MLMGILFGSDKLIDATLQPSTFNLERPNHPTPQPSLPPNARMSASEKMISLRRP